MHIPQEIILYPNSTASSDDQVDSSKPFFFLSEKLHNLRSYHWGEFHITMFLFHTPFWNGYIQFNQMHAINQIDEF